MNSPIIVNETDSPKSLREHILCWLNEFEEIFTTLASRLGPWLAPISPAYFVSRAAVTHLHTNLYIAIIMAVALEFVGVSSIHLAVRSWTWNHTKRKSDPTAPIGIGISLASLYFLATITLTVIVEVLHEAVIFAPMIFVILTGVGYCAMALNWRLGQWETERQAEVLGRQREKAQVFTTVKAARQEVAQLTQTIDSLTQQRLALEAEVLSLKQLRISATVADQPPETDSESDNSPATTSASTKDQAIKILTSIYQGGGDISGSELGRQLKRSPSLGRQLKADLLPQVLATVQPQTVNVNGHLNGKAGNNGIS